MTTPPPHTHINPRLKVSKLTAVSTYIESKYMKSSIFGRKSSKIQDHVTHHKIEGIRIMHFDMIQYPRYEGTEPE